MVCLGRNQTNLLRNWRVVLAAMGLTQQGRVREALLPPHLKWTCKMVPPFIDCSEDKRKVASLINWRNGFNSHRCDCFGKKVESGLEILRQVHYHKNTAKNIAHN